MGIASLYQILQSICPQAVTKVRLEMRARGVKQQQQPVFDSVYDHVYYDINNVIYSLVGKNRSEESFFLKLYKEIDVLLRSARPRHTLFLAVDGPGPRAKVSTQLARRRRSPFKEQEGVQRISFTPGTLFMHRLQQTLLVYGATRSADSRSKHLAVWVSGSDCPGEGENKCFHHMRRVPAFHKCLVIGNDSDLIAYALRASSEVHVMRSETIVNCKVLREHLAQSVGAPEKYESRVVDDFLFMSLLNGNDYVPGVAFFDFRQMWAAYVKAKTNDPNGLRDQFVYDSEKRIVNWGLLLRLHEMTGADTSLASLNDTADFCDTFGNVHPRFVVNEILQLGDDESVYETTTETSSKVRVRLTSVNMGNHPWMVEGAGASQQKALLDTAIKALSPGSPMLEHVSESGRYSPEAKKKIRKSLTTLRTRAVDLSQAFQARGLVAKDFVMKVGDLSGADELPPSSSSASSSTAEKFVPSKDDVYMRYLEGLVWSFDMYGGQVKNFGYHYPYAERMTLAKLCKAAPQIASSWDQVTSAVPALPPLVLGLCLLGGEARKLLPAPFCDMDLENDPEVGHIFKDESEALIRDRHKMTEYLNQVEKFAQKHLENGNLSPEAEHLMHHHHPTAFMDRTNPLLRTFTREELLSHNYLPPKLPASARPYMALRDAPASTRIVSAFNIPKSQHGHWFQFPGGNMQTRKLFTMTRKVLFRK